MGGWVAQRAAVEFGGEGKRREREKREGERVMVEVVMPVAMVETVAMVMISMNAIVC